MTFPSSANLDLAPVLLFRPDFYPADDGGHRPALEFPAEERAVRRFARGFGTLIYPFAIRIKDRHVRIRADAERAFFQIQQSRRI